MTEPTQPTQEPTQPTRRGEAVRRAAPSRRHVIAGALAASGALVTARPAAARPFGTSGPALVRDRAGLRSAIQTGDVTERSAVAWARSERPGRLIVRLSDARGRWRELVGPWATEATDLTAQLDVERLTPGRDYDVRLLFEDADGVRGRTGHASFSTPDVRPARTRFVWTGDTAGQGWGINPDLGGMRGYRAMLDVAPDFFLHSGDTIYADGPISASVTEPDGQVWRNLVTPQVAKVAETLDEFRGRHRYNLMDANVRALAARVPIIAQWDDHETRNNWYPGQVITDDARYTERSVDVLAERARRAFFDYQPISRGAVRGRHATLGGEPKVYRKISRGAALDVFCLDMRTYRGPNTRGDETSRVPFLGTEQVDWLVRELTASRATWKVIASDMPLGLVVPDGPVNIEAIANRLPGQPLGREIELAYLLSQLRRRGIRNVVWLTADVHYCAAHRYDPARAAFTDFDEFWEFVAGPIHAGAFGPNDLDPTFGPQLEFRRTPPYANKSPRDGLDQYFGMVDIDEEGQLEVSLRDANGTVLYTKALQPRRQRGHRR